MQGVCSLLASLAIKYLSRCFGAKHAPFSLIFSYGCPEPVLAKRSFVYIYIYVCSSKRAFLAGDDTLIVSSLLMGMLGSFLLIDSSPGENENEKNAICTVSALLFILKVITLPRQARDKHRKSGETSAFFSSAGDPEATLLPLPRFIAGFALITIAFPFGRTSVMGCFSKVLGPTPQGAWVGVLLAVGAVPRIIGPWWSLFALGK